MTKVDGSISPDHLGEWKFTMSDVVFDNQTVSTFQFVNESKSTVIQQQKVMEDSKVDYLR